MKSFPPPVGSPRPFLVLSYFPAPPFFNPKMMELIALQRFLRWGFFQLFPRLRRGGPAFFCILTPLSIPLLNVCVGRGEGLPPPPPPPPHPPPNPPPPPVFFGQPPPGPSPGLPFAHPTVKGEFPHSFQDSPWLGNSPFLSAKSFLGPLLHQVLWFFIPDIWTLVQRLSEALVRVFLAPPPTPIPSSPPRFFHLFLKRPLSANFPRYRAEASFSCLSDKDGFPPVNQLPFRALGGPSSRLVSSLSNFSLRIRPSFASLIFLIFATDERSC